MALNQSKGRKSVRKDSNCELAFFGLGQTRTAVKTQNQDADAFDEVDELTEQSGLSRKLDSDSFSMGESQAKSSMSASQTISSNQGIVIAPDQLAISAESSVYQIEKTEALAQRSFKHSFKTETSRDQQLTPVRLQTGGSNFEEEFCASVMKKFRSPPKEVVHDLDQDDPEKPEEPRLVTQPSDQSSFNESKKSSSIRVSMVENPRSKQYPKKNSSFTIPQEFQPIKAIDEPNYYSFVKNDSGLYESATQDLSAAHRQEEPVQNQPKIQESMLTAFMTAKAVNDPEHQWRLCPDTGAFLFNNTQLDRNNVEPIAPTIKVTSEPESEKVTQVQVDPLGSRVEEQYEAPAAAKKNIDSVIFIDKRSFNFTMNDANGLYVFTTKREPSTFDIKAASSRTSLGEQTEIHSAEVGLGKDQQEFEDKGKGFQVMKFSDVPINVAVAQKLEGNQQKQLDTDQSQYIQLPETPVYKHVFARKFGNIASYLDRKQAKKVQDVVKQLKVTHKKFTDRADGSIVPDSDEEKEYKPKSNIFGLNTASPQESGIQTDQKSARSKSVSLEPLSPCVEKNSQMSSQRSQSIGKQSSSSSSIFTDSDSEKNVNPEEDKAVQFLLSQMNSVRLICTKEITDMLTMQHNKKLQAITEFYEKQIVQLKEKSLLIQQGSDQLLAQLGEVADQLHIAVQSIPKFEKKAKAPLLAELQVKGLLIDRFQKREKEMIRQLRALRIILQKPRMYGEYQKALGRARDADNLKALFQHYEGRTKEVAGTPKASKEPTAMQKMMKEALKMKVYNSEFYDKTVRLVFRGKQDIDFDDTPLGWDSVAEKFDEVQLEGEKFPMPERFDSSVESLNKTMPNGLWKKHSQDRRRGRPKLPPLKFTNSVVESEDPLTVFRQTSNGPHRHADHAWDILRDESTMKYPESKRQKSVGAQRPRNRNNVFLVPDRGELRHNILKCKHGSSSVSSGGGVGTLAQSPQLGTKSSQLKYDNAKFSLKKAPLSRQDTESISREPTPQLGSPVQQSNFPKSYHQYVQKTERQDPLQPQIRLNVNSRMTSRQGSVGDAVSSEQEGPSRQTKQSNIGYRNSFNNMYTYRSTGLAASRQKTANQQQRKRYNLGLNEDLKNPVKSTGGLQPLRMNVPNQPGINYDIIPHATPRVVANDRRIITPRNHNTSQLTRSFMSSKQSKRADNQSQVKPTVPSVRITNKGNAVLVSNDNQDTKQNHAILPSQAIQHKKMRLNKLKETQAAKAVDESTDGMFSQSQIVRSPQPQQNSRLHSELREGKN